MDIMDTEDGCHIFSLTEGLGNSYVDADRLLKPESADMRAIGMDNFKSQRNKSSPKLVHKQLTNGTTLSPAKQRWQMAARKIKLIKDPWAEFHIEAYPVEKVVRHRYNPIKKEWKKDECVVKMEQKQFANGAMRACFRLKKLSNFSHDKSWQHASNYVAKMYMGHEIGRERYFEDVKLQMDAKLWAEIYNRHNPPKKIDIFQVSILEFKERPDSPLFHLEHYIEGKYIKYNSNAGFVDLDLRYTPHAFSHFSFECSNHELIIVDIQGVGDLYTDPQIHTASGNDYGDGNLGIKGFALFFYSHVCNDICKSLGLSQFDLAPTELKSHEKVITTCQNMAMTKRKGREEPVKFSTSWSARTRYLMNRLSSTDENSNSSDLAEMDDSDGCFSLSLSPSHNCHQISNSFQRQFSASNQSYFLSCFSDNSNNTSMVDSPFETDEAFKFVNSKAFHKPRPSAVLAEKEVMLNADTEYRRHLQSFSSFDSILGKIHYEMCKYHEVGRFTVNENDPIDMEAAFFHLQQSANLGDIEALVNLSKLYMQFPHDILPDYKVEDSDHNYDIGFDYMIEAAEKGDKNSLYYVAKAFDTGIGLSKSKTIDWFRAVEYYRKLISESHDDKADEISYADISTDYDAVYIILARIGEIYLEGKNGVEANPQEAADLFTEAAEMAMQFGKGRLANKYYSLVEQANAQI